MLSKVPALRPSCRQPRPGEVKLQGSKEAYYCSPHRWLPKGRDRLLGSAAHWPHSCLGSRLGSLLHVSVAAPRSSCVPSPLFSWRLNVLMQAGPSVSSSRNRPLLPFPAPGPLASRPAHWMRGLAPLSVRKLVSFPLPIWLPPKGPDRGRSSAP